MENLYLEVTASGSEVILRQGAAQVIHDPVPVVLTGTITAPGDFYKNRIDAIMYQMSRDGVVGRPLASLDINAASHVVANYTTRTITLRWNERDKFANVIAGTLALHPALKSLTINSNQTYDEKGLLGVLKYNRAWFQDREKYNRLVVALQKFKAQVDVTFVNENDYKGAEALQKLTKITHDVPLEFDMAMPVFAGVEPFEFKIDVCVGLSSGHVEFWLESVDLHEAIVTQTETIFETELERFVGVAIIKQY